MTKPTDNGYTVVATIQKGRIVSTVTMRVIYGEPRFSFALLKEYERNGKVEHSKWMEVSQIDDVVKVLHKTKEFIESEIAKHKAVNPSREARRR